MSNALVYIKFVETAVDKRLKLVVILHPLILAMVGFSLVILNTNKCWKSKKTTFCLYKP